MIHKSPLIEGRFVKRYKRFFADVIVDGEVVVAHVPNTGSMKTCMEENAPCFLTHNPDPKRKLKWTLERVVMSKSQVGVNTGIPNNLVYEAWENKIVPHWKTFDCAQKEVKINAESRLDMALWKSKDSPDLKKITADKLDQLAKIHFIEVKNVTMALGDVALFPDAVTSRGAKHIEELVKLMDEGHTCEMVFVIQRENINKFEIAKDIDPTYDTALNAAIKKGLKVTALKVEFKKDETKIVGLL
jgi:sugar fermentation stimulation protein A